MNYKNKFESRLRNPSSEFSVLPRLSISASLSIKSTISLVRLQSNSLTVHFVCKSTSNLSSTDKKGSLRPLYRSINSLALVVNGVWTSVYLSSVLTHNFGSDIAFKNLLIFSVLFWELAVIFNLSIYWRILVSLCKSCCKASFFSSGFKSVDVFIFFVSFRRQASNSL